MTYVVFALDQATHFFHCFGWLGMLSNNPDSCAKRWNTGIATCITNSNTMNHHLTQRIFVIYWMLQQETDFMMAKTGQGVAFLVAATIEVTPIEIAEWLIETARNQIWNLLVWFINMMSEYFHLFLPFVLLMWLKSGMMMNVGWSSVAQSHDSTSLRN